MMDLFEDAPPPGNSPEFSVSEISGAIKRTIEGEFSHVRVRGEVGRVVVARTGHLYFDLKDDRNVLASVSWKGQVSKLSHMPEEGMEVIAVGKLTTFGPQSKYQLNVEDLTPAGAGALMAMLEKRKAALAAEGLFAPERKQRLPFLPEVIGVVTSPTGAVIRDILHRLRDRFPRKVLVWPVAVQGAGCAAQVAAAIDGFNALKPGGALPRPDLIIVARGGGSIEDLWGFNEEIVVRAAAASRIPLISAVGHETDTTLIDFASDMRAPTPTAAAELAVPVRLDLLAWVDEQGARLKRGIGQGVQTRDQRLRDLSRALSKPDALLDGPRQRLDHLAERLPAALRSATAAKQLALSKSAGSLRPSLLRRMIETDGKRLADRAGRLAPALTRSVANKRPLLAHAAAGLRPRDLTQALEKRRDRLAGVAQRFRDRAERKVAETRARLDALDKLRETLGYKETLRRGYAVVWADGRVAGSVATIKAAKTIEIEVADGRVPLDGQSAKPRGKGSTGSDQGSLF